MCNFNMHIQQVLIYFFVFILVLVRDGKCSQSKVNIPDPCQRENHLSKDIHTNVAKIIEFSSKLRRISDTLYKEHMNLTDALIKLVGLPASEVPKVCQQDPSLIFPHPNECQLYYNCSMTYNKVPANLEQHLMECPYPEVFSTRSLKCENFTRVCCDTRQVIKDKCDYRSYVGSKRTCHRTYPSCKRKQDGLHQGYQGPNSYIDCFQERLINKGTCKDDKLWDIYKIPYNGKCTNPFEVPHKDGGFLSSCEGKTDGNYRFEHDSLYMGQGDYFGFGRQCDAFYRCQGGVATAVKCPNGTVFESESRS
ncbi:chitin-binding domain protein cbd-1-like [Saccostrea cucullata]|uniref:chitin-binding domain protein cbd-1-like n=1 Tax=Saccostrea cuccullata TaxID=36930 RepID=UPI002ED31493